MASTIKDIARKLNISISTVSYALNGGPRPVPAEVRAKVLAVARELNYSPNTIARSMATGRTDTIAVVPPRGTHPLLPSGYIQTVLNGIVEAAEELRQDILLHTIPDDKVPQGVARSVFGGKADGIFLMAPDFDSSLAGEIAERNFPCVVYSADGPPGTLTITIDNVEATRMAMDHLVQLGHRDIAHIAGRPTMRDAIQRRETYLTYLQEIDVPIREDWVAVGDFTYRTAYNVAIIMLAREERPTAVLAANDESGFGVMDAAQELGIRVPEDLSVIAFDVLPLPEYIARNLSSVRQPIHQMAAQAVHLLVQWAKDGVRPEQERYVFPAELVIKHSTAPCPHTRVH